MDCDTDQQSERSSTVSSSSASCFTDNAYMSSSDISVPEYSRIETLLNSLTLLLSLLVILLLFHKMTIVNSPYSATNLHPAFHMTTHLSPPLHKARNLHYPFHKVNTHFLKNKYSVLVLNIQHSKLLVTTSIKQSNLVLCAVTVNQSNCITFITMLFEIVWICQLSLMSLLLLRILHH